MNRTKIKNYAPQARRDFIQAVTDRASYYGIAAKKVEPVVEKGDVAIIDGRAFPRSIVAKRTALIERIERIGFEQTMEAMSYTWFNRLVAIRFMELHGYLDHGYRVLSNPDPAKTTPEFLDHAEHVDLPGLDKNKVIKLKLDGNKEAELYRMLLLAQCKALHSAMPFLFERIDDETELLLPDNLLHSDSVIRTLVGEIDEDDWQEVEIIGWLYESYISERYETVIGDVVAGDDIPAATQRFTPKWVVRYLVQNTLGRLWLSTYPQSPLKAQMRYYIEPAEQTPEVQEQLKAITPTSLNPEEVTLLDPACGSAHILVEAYDLFKAIYQERGYRAKDIPRLILEKNLFGLEIDDRAAQLAAFAVLMKARADDRRILDGKTQPHVQALVQTKDMDPGDIAAALNVPILKEPLPPPDRLFENEDTLFTKQRMSVGGDISQADVAALIALFEEAKNFGSLISVAPELAARLPLIEQRAREVVRHAEDLFSQTTARFLPVIEQAKMLAAQYDCVVANPPYMGSKYYNPKLKAFVNALYNDAKSDLYACFIQRDCAFAKQNRFVGMITIPNWMFLSSFEDVRRALFDHETIDSFVHNGRGVFGSDFGSCSFVLRIAHLPLFKGTFRRLFEKASSVTGNEELEARFFGSTNYYASPSDFKKVPGFPIAYWISDAIRDTFAANPQLETVADARQGLATSDNSRFLRLWHEVGFACIGFGHLSRDAAVASKKKWFPYNKGGNFRRWYGNFEFVLNWENEGSELANFDKAVIRNPSYYFREGVTWSDVTIAENSFRYLPSGFICDSTGHTAYFRDSATRSSVLCMMNTRLYSELVKIVNPTVHFHIGYFNKLPFRLDSSERLTSIADEAILLSRNDWSLNETTWDFSCPPLLAPAQEKTSVEVSWNVYREQCGTNRQRLKWLEAENNRLFLRAHDLDGELSAEVADELIALRIPNREADLKELLSFAVGCMMGRFSLDKPGLIYAQGGNVGFDPSQYRTFAADPDGIVPATEVDWFSDDACHRLVEFIRVAWPPEHLEENLKFIADSLGPNQGEQPRDTIRRYLATGFYKHHLSMYKRRPIYWLFSSGKLRAFQALVYLHRYHEGTLSRMRTEYVIPLQGKFAARINQLASDLQAATTTSRRKKLEKERDALLKQQTELLAFDEKLRHYADQRITLDLDDGVKLNYGKFGDLLAELKSVIGNTPEE